MDSDLHKLSLHELEEVFQEVFDMYPDYTVIDATYKFAKEAHGDQKRAGGKPYIIHPLRMIVIMYRDFKIKDRLMLQGALLHDVVEDTDYSQEYIVENYGEKVADYVRQLTRERVHDEDNRPNAKFEAKKAKFAKQLNSPVKVRMIKAIDLIDQMYDWLEIPKDDDITNKFPRWMFEAKEFYLPLARSIGPKFAKPMQVVLSEMKSRGFRAGNGEFDA
ncbi:MAG: HD domain-containing protein [Candidatus Dojkabacteria bacterium]